MPLEYESAYKPVTATSQLTIPDYTKASSGMGLNVPGYVGEGNYATPQISTPTAKESTNVYDSDWMDKWLKDTTGKYIGSTPKLGTSPSGESTTKLGEPVKAVPSTQEPSDTAQTMGTIASAGAAAVADISKAKANLAQTERMNDLRRWQEQGKYWFDPNQDLKPDLEAYLDEMPSATDALSQGTLTGGELSQSQGGEVALGIGTLGLSTLFDNDMAEYIWQKGGEGALAGSASGNWIGTVVGAAVGVVEGIFTWSSAEDEDKKRKAQARSEYEKLLKQWTINRNKRLAEQRRQISAQREAEEADREAKKKTGNVEKIKNVREMRNQIANAFINATALSNKNRAQRLSRWGK